MDMDSPPTERQFTDILGGDKVIKIVFISLNKNSLINEPEVQILPIDTIGVIGPRLVGCRMAPPTSGTITILGNNQW